MDENQNEYLGNEIAEQQTGNQSDKKRSFTSGVIVGLVVALLISGGMYIVSSMRFKQASSEKTENTSVLSNQVISKIHVLEESINEYYLDEVDEDAVADSLYAGLIEGLGDKYSAYYTAEELQTVREQAEGVFYGIGASITIDADTQSAKVAKVLPDTPAEESGLKDNDIIVMVDEESTQGKSLNDIVGMIKGKENTEVHLTVYREGEYDYLEFDITRRAIETTTVSYEMDTENKIAIIRIAEFDAVTTDQFTDAFTQAKEEGMRGLVIDLRDNPGGNLSAVVAIARELLPKGLVVYTEDKYGKREEYSCDGKNQLEVPLVVLVNENSASAAEILSGAIKDYEIGTILGTKTYGKGIVQKIFGLTDGSAVKLTVSHYYTPNGNDIHGVGIEPDEELELDVKKYVEEGIDNQMERAKEILMGEMQ